MHTGGSSPFNKKEWVIKEWPMCNRAITVSSFRFVRGQNTIIFFNTGNILYNLFPGNSSHSDCHSFNIYLFVCDFRSENVMSSTQIRAVLIFMQGVSLTLPVLPYLFIYLFINLGSFSYTSHADFVFMWGVSLTHPMLASFIWMWGVSLTHPVLASVLFAEVFLNIPCCLQFYMGSFSTSHDDCFYLGSFSYTSHDDCFYLGSFSYTSHSGFIYFIFDFFYLGSFSYTSRVGFTFIWGVSLTLPVLAPCFFFFFFFFFYVGSFCYTFRNYYFF